MHPTPRTTRVGNNVVCDAAVQNIFVGQALSLASSLFTAFRQQTTVGPFDCESAVGSCIASCDSVSYASVNKDKENIAHVQNHARISRAHQHAGEPKLQSQSQDIHAVQALSSEVRPTVLCRHSRNIRSTL